MPDTHLHRTSLILVVANHTPNAAKPHVKPGNTVRNFMLFDNNGCFLHASFQPNTMVGAILVSSKKKSQKSNLLGQHTVSAEQKERNMQKCAKKRKPNFLLQ